MENHSIIPNKLLFVTSKVFFRSLNGQKTAKILIYHVGNIGDIIVATPAYRAVRKAFPESKITLLTSPGRRGLPGAKEIIAPLNLVDNLKVFYPEEIRSLKKIINLCRSIKKGDFDFLVYLPANQWGFWHILRDMIFFRLAGIKRAVGFEIYEGYHLYKKYKQRPVNEVDRLVKQLEPLGITSGEYTLEFPIKPEDRCFASDLFQKYCVKDERLKIVVHPGGKKQTKLWSKQNFAILADRLIEEMGVQVILVGSADEVEMVKEIISLMKQKAVSLAGSLTLSQLAAVIDKTNLMLSNDSGPMHIAAALKKLVVALFSGVDIPNLWYPYGDKNTVIRKDVECSPCFRSICSEHYCMNEITVDEVFQAVKSTLSRSV